MALLEAPAKAPDAGGSSFTSPSTLRTGQAGGGREEAAEQGTSQLSPRAGAPELPPTAGISGDPTGVPWPWSYTSSGPPRAGPQVEPPTPST